MENKSKDVSWLDRVIKRYKETGKVIPDLQLKLYEKIRDHWTMGRTVIDVGCSIGIGTNILAHNSRHAWGVDINTEAIDFAQKVLARPNLSFDTLDIENPPTRQLSSFEIVVMSEVIEHLKDPETGLNTIKRFFSPKTQTIGFITCPNHANETSRENEAKHGLHIQHWTAGEFYALLIKNFEHVTLFSVDKLDQWNQEETVSGDSTDYLIVAKVERIK